MDSQGPLPHVGATNANDASTISTIFRAQGGGIPPPPFSQGFQPLGGQMPILFPQSFMPPVQGVGFAPPLLNAPAAAIDMTPWSQKRGSHECITYPSKSTKKRRGTRKKPKIVELDDAKDKVDVLKSGGHWKDHWVIQFITIRGEMHNTFSTPPKQGTLRNSFFMVFGFGFNLDIIFLPAAFFVSSLIVVGHAPRTLRNPCPYMGCWSLPPVYSRVL
jgi:hypothetical protein